ncbi:hypothetical protein [Streptomyces sp. NPDC056821]|uniref:hypothetical protein n=1 Tax=unclassified Streptomyces TaxID=2593676 RepID=UPI003676E0AC
MPRSSEAELYLKHRGAWKAENPLEGVSLKQWEARCEIVPLARTIADLAESQEHPQGATVGWSDPDVPENVSSEPGRDSVTWGPDAVRERLVPVVAGLRSIGQALDAVDAVTLNVGYFAKHGQSADPDVVLNSLTMRLGEARWKMLRTHGLGSETRDYLSYRYLEVGRRQGGSQRLLWVKSREPWEAAARSLAAESPAPSPPPSSS